jgi:hypothetical protein
MALTKTQKWVLGGVGVVAGASLVEAYVLQPLLRKNVNSGTPTTSTTATVSQVTGVTATLQGMGTQAVVSWQPVTVQGASVIYTVQAGSQTMQTASTSATLNGLTTNTQVQIRVQACVGGSSVAQVCGPWSATYTLNVTAPTIGAVQGISAQVNGTTAVVSWQAVPMPSGVQGSIAYTIQHTDASGNAVTTTMGTSPATVTTGATSYTFQGLTPGAQMHFRIEACLNYTPAS